MTYRYDYDWGDEKVSLDEQVEVVDKWLAENEMEMRNNTASEKTRNQWRENIARLYSLEEEYLKMESEE